VSRSKPDTPKCHRNNGFCRPREATRSPQLRLNAASKRKHSLAQNVMAACARGGTRIAQRLHMFASLIRTALLLSGQAGNAGADADALDLFWALFSVACAILGGLWLLVKYVPAGAKPPQSAGASRASTMPRASTPRASRAATAVAPPTPRSLRPIPRRVIRLHAVTPGQSEHEYNVGDQWGTRGSALARVA